MKPLSLPVKLGGLGIVIFADIATMKHQNSRNIAESMTKLHLPQSNKYNINREELAKLKNIKKEKLKRKTESFQSVIIDLPINKIRSGEINQDKGASKWLATVPLKEEGYSLSKQKF